MTAVLPTLVMVVRGDHATDLQLFEAALARSGVAEMVRVVRASDTAELAAIVGGAEALVYPCLSEATALPALEALSLGVPVICSRAGALPETVGGAGIIVEPRDPERMAAAIEAVWAGGSLSQQLRRQARRRADAVPRTWSDVARETRVVYAAAADGLEQ